MYSIVENSIFKFYVIQIAILQGIRNYLKLRSTSRLKGKYPITKLIIKLNRCENYKKKPRKTNKIRGRARAVKQKRNLFPFPEQMG